MIEFTPDLVVVGAFNPMIIRPDWLIKEKVCTPAEEIPVEVQLGSGVQAFVFELGGAKWTVTPPRLQLTAAKGDPSALPKLVIEVLKRLPHTPVSAIGMNLGANFDSNHWKNPEPPHMPDGILDQIRQLGEISEREHKVQVVAREKHLINISIREHPDKMTVSLNYHYQLKSMSHATDEVLPLFDENIAAGKRFIATLVEGGAK